MTFVPKLASLPDAQRALWDELATVPSDFVLYGGTALALRLGHRVSIDFDFFTHVPLDHAALDRTSLVANATVLQEGVDTRVVLVRRPHGEVKFSFFGGLRFGRVAEPDVAGGIRVASLLDLGGTKIKALLQRVEAKDYRDIVALLEAGVELETILGAARSLFGASFNPLVARKALTYFEGGDLETLEPSARARLVEAATRELDVPVIAVVANQLT